MKLRNKKTGEIKEVIVGGYPVTCKTKMWECSEMDVNEETGYKSLGTYSSLAELNEEWEDYDEPKDFYFIQADGDIHLVQCKTPKYQLKKFKSVGNYFETKEEAEKALEKLKAWKRLKDKGFRFTGINDNEESQLMIYECGILCEANMEHRLSKDEDFILLFGDDDELRKQKR